MQRNILITGGAGFIGSHVVRRFVTKYPQYRIVNLDALTYAGNLENLRDVEHAPNYTFVKADICDADAVAAAMKEHAIDGIIHLAAESHVDRSISDPMAFVNTNVIGTVTLLNVARESWKGAMEGKRFYHVSTDEVYGSLHDDSLFLETTAYDPQSPYSASKASSDHFVRAYGNTYKLPFVLSNCSNNYGSHHFPEKLIPLMINNIRTASRCRSMARARTCAIGCGWRIMPAPSTRCSTRAGTVRPTTSEGTTSGRTSTWCICSAASWTRSSVVRKGRARS